MLRRLPYQRTDSPGNARAAIPRPHEIPDADQASSHLSARSVNKCPEWYAFSYPIRCHKATFLVLRAGSEETQVLRVEFTSQRSRLRKQIEQPAARGAEFHFL